MATINFGILLCRPMCMLRNLSIAKLAIDKLLIELYNNVSCL